MKFKVRKSTGRNGGHGGCRWVVRGDGELVSNGAEFQFRKVRNLGDG